ncbi:putative acetyltransferase [compost metagenome]
MPIDFLQSVSADDKAQHFEILLNQNKEQIVIMLVDEIAAGCMMMDYSTEGTENLAEISSIYLLKEYQGLGYGKGLLDWGLERLRERGYQKVILWVLEENKHAIRFYERQNFKPDGTEREILRGKSLKQIRYQRAL